MSEIVRIASSFTDERPLHGEFHTAAARRTPRMAHQQKSQFIFAAQARRTQETESMLIWLAKLKLQPAEGFKLLQIAAEHWRRFPPHPGTAILATMDCPGCGKEFSISGTIHVVLSDGSVTPSMVCPYEPCKFHEFIQLMGWTPAPSP